MAINTNNVGLDGSKKVVLMRGPNDEILMDIRGNLSDGVAAALNLQFKERTNQRFTYIGDYSNINTSRMRNPSPVRSSFLEKPALEDLTAGNVKGEDGKSPIQIVDTIVDLMSEAEQNGRRVVLRVIDEDNFRTSGVADILAEAVELRKEQVEYIVAAAQPEEEEGEDNTGEDTTDDDTGTDDSNDETNGEAGDESGDSDDTTGDGADTSVPDGDDADTPDEKPAKDEETKTATEAYQSLKIACKCYGIRLVRYKA